MVECLLLKTGLVWVFFDILTLLFPNLVVVRLSCCLSLSPALIACVCVWVHVYCVYVCVCELLFMCVCIEVFLFAAFRVLCFCLLSYRLHQRSIKCVCVSVRVRGCECGCAAVCATNKNVAIFNWVPLGSPESELDKNSLIKKPQEKSCHNK